MKIFQFQNGKNTRFVYQNQNPANESSVSIENSTDNTTRNLLEGLSLEIKSGDTVSDIVNLCTNDKGESPTWEQIYAMNKDLIGANPNKILPGQELKLPKGYTLNEDALNKKQKSNLEMWKQWRAEMKKYKEAGGTELDPTNAKGDITIAQIKKATEALGTREEVEAEDANDFEYDIDKMSDQVKTFSEFLDEDGKLLNPENVSNSSWDKWLDVKGELTDEDLKYLSKMPVLNIRSDKSDISFLSALTNITELDVDHATEIPKELLNLHQLNTTKASFPLSDFPNLIGINYDEFPPIGDPTRETINIVNGEVVGSDAAETTEALEQEAETAKTTATEAVAALATDFVIIDEKNLDTAEAALQKSTDLADISDRLNPDNLVDRTNIEKLEEDIVTYKETLTAKQEAETAEGERKKALEAINALTDPAATIPAIAKKIDEANGNNEMQNKFDEKIEELKAAENTEDAEYDIDKMSDQVKTFSEFLDEDGKLLNPENVSNSSWGDWLEIENELTDEDLKYLSKMPRLNIESDESDISFLSSLSNIAELKVDNATEIPKEFVNLRRLDNSKASFPLSDFPNLIKFESQYLPNIGDPSRENIKIVNGEIETLTAAENTEEKTEILNTPEARKAAYLELIKEDYDSREDWNWEKMFALIKEDNSLISLGESRKAIHYASHYRPLEEVQYIVENGGLADISAPDKIYQTPLYLAQEGRNTQEVIDYLILQGAAKTIPNQELIAFQTIYPLAKDYPTIDADNIEAAEAALQKAIDVSDGLEGVDRTNIEDLQVKITAYKETLNSEPSEQEAETAKTSATKAIAALFTHYPTVNADNLKDAEEALQAAFELANISDDLNPNDLVNRDEFQKLEIRMILVTANDVPSSLLKGENISDYPTLEKIDGVLLPTDATERSLLVVDQNEKLTTKDFRLNDYPELESILGITLPTDPTERANTFIENGIAKTLLNGEKYKMTPSEADEFNEITEKLPILATEIETLSSDIKNAEDFIFALEYKELDAAAFKKIQDDLFAAMAMKEAGGDNRFDFNGSTNDSENASRVKFINYVANQCKKQGVRPVTNDELFDLYESVKDDPTSDVNDINYGSKNSKEEDRVVENKIDNWIQVHMFLPLNKKKSNLGKDKVARITKSNEQTTLQIKKKFLEGNAIFIERSLVGAIGSDGVFNKDAYTERHNQEQQTIEYNASGKLFFEDENAIGTMRHDLNGYLLNDAFKQMSEKIEPLTENEKKDIVREVLDDGILDGDCFSYLEKAQILLKLQCSPEIFLEEEGTILFDRVKNVLAEEIETAYGYEKIISVLDYMLEVTLAEIDWDAEIDENDVFLNEDYEREWSNRQKKLYRRNKQIPGLKDFFLTKIREYKAELEAKVRQ